MSAMATRNRRFLHDNSLSLVVFGAFLLLWFGQSVAGHRTFNEDQRSHGSPAIGYGEYLTTGHFGEATFENWESEFLQMGSYILLTVWLRQRGSAESKSLDGGDDVDEDPQDHRDDAGVPWPVRRGGIALALYRNSLSAAFLTLFVLSWVSHGVTGAREYSSEQVEHGQPRVTAVEYMRSSQFWSESLQNWQSEFLAVGAIVVMSIFLRQQGSPESKPVHEATSETG